MRDAFGVLENIGHLLQEYAILSFDLSVPLCLENTNKRFHLTFVTVCPLNLADPHLNAQVEALALCMLSLPSSIWFFFGLDLRCACSCGLCTLMADLMFWSLARWIWWSFSYHLAESSLLAFGWARYMTLSYYAFGLLNKLIVVPNGAALSVVALACLVCLRKDDSQAI